MKELHFFKCSTFETVNQLNTFDAVIRVEAYVHFHSGCVVRHLDKWYLQQRIKEIMKQRMNKYNQIKWQGIYKIALLSYEHKLITLITIYKSSSLPIKLSTYFLVMFYEKIHY